LARLITNISLLIVTGIILSNIIVFLLQPGMLFYPYEELESTPADWELAYEDVVITTSDAVKLHGWYLPVKESRQVVLFFHGNAGNISHRGESLAIFNSIGVNVLIVDYRGYGKSEGSASEEGLYCDAMAAWQYLITMGFKPGDIIIFGRSLGGAVATHLATQVKPRALILESTFTSTRDMIDRMMPFASRFVYMRYSFNTEEAIKQVTSPVLVMHSKSDEIVPYELGQKVYQAAMHPKKFYLLVGGHNDGFITSMPGYRYRIKSFLESI